MPYNLNSNALSEPVDLGDTVAWLRRVVAAGKIAEAYQEVINIVVANLDKFVRWPERAILLWEGCNRIPLNGAKHRYHTYLEPIKLLADEWQYRLDGRPNGPAIAAFRLAGGIRGWRFGSTNDRSIHHLYSGKFPYVGLTRTLHATKEGLHFTQSAGLVAVDPISDALCDEFPFFAWFMRSQCF